MALKQQAAKAKAASKKPKPNPVCLPTPRCTSSICDPKKQLCLKKKKNSDAGAPRPPSPPQHRHHLRNKPFAFQNIFERTDLS